MCVKVNYYFGKKKNWVIALEIDCLAIGKLVSMKRRNCQKKSSARPSFCSRSISRNRKFCFLLTFGSTFTFILCVHSTPGGLDAHVWLANSYNSSNVLLSCVSIEYNTTRTDEKGKLDKSRKECCTFIYCVRRSAIELTKFQQFRHMKLTGIVYPIR